MLCRHKFINRLDYQVLWDSADSTQSTVAIHVLCHSHMNGICVFFLSLEGPHRLGAAFMFQETEVFTV